MLKSRAYMPSVFSATVCFDICHTCCYTASVFFTHNIFFSTNRTFRRYWIHLDHIICKSNCLFACVTSEQMQITEAVYTYTIRRLTMPPVPSKLYPPLTVTLKPVYIFYSIDGYCTSIKRIELKRVHTFIQVQNQSKGVMYTDGGLILFHGH